MVVSRSATMFVSMLANSSLIKKVPKSVAKSTIAVLESLAKRPLCPGLPCASPL